MSANKKLPTATHMVYPRYSRDIQNNIHVGNTQGRDNVVGGANLKLVKTRENECTINTLGT
jgi:hypothetical protein